MRKRIFRKEKKKDKKPQEPKKWYLKRKVHFPDGEIWSWEIERGWISIRSPDCKNTTRITLYKFVGKTREDYEDYREYYHNSEAFSISPSKVKKWILENLKDKND